MTNPQLSYLKQQVNVSKQVKRVENNKLLPDFSVGFFTQSLTGFQNTNGQDVYFPSSKSFQGFQLGLSIPLWVAPQLARAKSAGIQEEITRNETEQFETNLKSNFAQAQKELAKNEASLLYYESSALQNANLIITQSGKAYKAGEIGYVEYLQSLKNAISIKSNYLLSLTQYNQSVLKIEYLLGKF
jgi:cobalt-zinc-cadmium resistance protein CzcA